jgi:phosphatidylserine/phosphatidylglycerophosphate/cardiolipin synthase-like enzyme
MTMQTKFLSTSLFLYCILVVACANAQQAGHPDFELVESIPIETVLDNPDIRETHEVWLEMINEAKQTIDIEQFYISNQVGESLEDVIQAIEHAADRGVAVRIIAESKFYKTYPETIERLRKRDNIFVRLIDFGKIAGGIQHAKYFIVDGESIFLGSQNFDWRSLKHIHELGLRIRSANAVRIYLDIFDLDWKLAEANDRSVAATDLVPRKYDVPMVSVLGNDTIVFTPTYSPVGLLVDSTLWDEPNIVRLIDGAQKEVSLQFLAYGTHARGGTEYHVLDDAVRRAADRGVKVRLLVADWEKDTPSERSLRNLARVPNIEVKFSNIPEWSGGYISFARVEHCKFVIADSSMFWLGTANAEKSYFHACRNLGIVARSAGLGSLLHRVFSRSWDGPYVERIDPDMKYARRDHGERK